jgi:hypothetical protein
MERSYALFVENGGTPARLLQLFQVFSDVCVVGEAVSLGHFQLVHRLVYEFQLHEVSLAVDQQEAVLDLAFLFLFTEVLELKQDDFVLVKLV